jgi:hypothetical protein
VNRKEAFDGWCVRGIASTRIYAFSRTASRKSGPSGSSNQRGARLKALPKKMKLLAGGGAAGTVGGGQARQAMLVVSLVPSCPSVSLTSIAAVQSLVASAVGDQSVFVPVGEFVK